MTVVLIDYGSGNLHSAAKALEREAKPLGLPVAVTSKAWDVANASHIVLPGVGAFAECYAGLHALTGMRETLEAAVLKKKKPFLGICVGMQLLAERGYENGNHSGLGWLKGDVAAITPAGKTLKIPHMGWNALEIKRKHSLFDGMASGEHMYFVHSYHFVGQDALAVTDYGGPVTAAVAKENIMGVQFHPEKSQGAGLKLLHNFLRM